MSYRTIISLAFYLILKVGLLCLYKFFPVCMKTYIMLDGCNIKDFDIYIEK